MKVPRLKILPPKLVFIVLGMWWAVATHGEDLPAQQPTSVADTHSLPADLKTFTNVDFVDGLAVDMSVIDDPEERKSPEAPEQVFEGRVPRVSPISANRAFSIGLGIMPNSIGRQIANPQLQGVSVVAQNRIAALMRAEEWEEAFQMVEDVLMTNPGQTNLVQQAAILASLAKRYEAANRYFKQHVKRFPRDAATLSAWSAVLIYTEKYDEARKVAQRSIAVNPNNLHGQLMLLCADLAQDRDIPKARQSFWDKLALNGIATVAGWLNGDAEQFRLGLSDVAWRRLCEITLGLGTHENLEGVRDTVQSAADEMALGNWLQALVYFDLGKDFGLDGVEFQQNMARCYYEVGNQVDALKIMHGLTLQSPDSATVWYNYGYVLIRFGIYDEAAMAFKRAHDMAPDAGETSFALACAYMGMKEEALAWGILDVLAKTHPEYMEQWVEGDQPYLVALRANWRFPKLMEKVKKRL